MLYSSLVYSQENTFSSKSKLIKSEMVEQWDGVKKPLWTFPDRKEINEKKYFGATFPHTLNCTNWTLKNTEQRPSLSQK